MHHVIHFVRTKTHKRNRFKRHQEKKRVHAFNSTVRVAKDYHIKPHSFTNVNVEGSFNQEGEWLVEKGLLPDAKATFFTTLNIIISLSNLITPVMNPTSHPRMIHRGETIGTIMRAAEYFNNLITEEEKEKLEVLMVEIQKLLALQMEKETLTSSTDSESFSKSREEDKEELGLKTAAMPDSEILPLYQIREILDVGSLPDHLHEEAWSMLKKLIQAFRFDSQLGPAKACIQVKEGINPISVLMYTASPAK